MVLKELGFKAGRIHESIVSTYDESKTATAAPMGISTDDLERIVVRPYLETTTYRNLSSRRCAVINLTHDPEIFYRTAFKDAKKGDRLPEDWFEGAITVDAPRLRAAYAVLEVSVEEVRAEGDRATALCRVRLAEERPLIHGPYCRSTFATIESIIHATRVKMFLEKEEMRKAEPLIGKINQYRDLVKRVDPNSTCDGIMEALILKIDDWRKGVGQRT